MGGGGGLVEYSDAGGQCLIAASGMPLMDGVWRRKNGPQFDDYIAITTTSGWAADDRLSRRGVDTYPIHQREMSSRSPAAAVLQS